MAAFLRNPSPRVCVSRYLYSTLSAPSSEKPSLSLRAIKSSIRIESDPEKIAEMFQKSSDSSRFRRDRSIFDLSVWKLARSRRSDLVERVLEYQKSFSGASPSKTEGFWIRLIKLYTDSGMVDHAVRTFHQMEEIGCNRTEKSLCALLTALLSNGQFNRVHECFAEIPKKIGVSPGVATYNLVLRAFLGEKSIAAARSLVAKMEKEHGVMPDLASYNILLGGYLVLRDESGFNEILKEISLKGFDPNVVTYNHMIALHCNKNASFKAKELIDVMTSKGIEPNSASFNPVIKGFCKEGKFESALDLCKESLKRKQVPPLKTIIGLVEGLVKISKVDEAKEVVEYMKKKKKLTGKAVDSWMKVESVLPL